MLPFMYMAFIPDIDCVACIGGRAIEFVIGIGAENGARWFISYADVFMLLLRGTVLE